MVSTAVVISFGLLMWFDPFCAWLVHGRMKWTALLGYLMDKMDCEIPPCLQVLRHVYRRGLDWFQQCESFRLGCSFVLVYTAHAAGCVAVRNLQLCWDSSLNENDRDHPSCLQALWHVYRRGLVWFQQCQSFHLGYSSVLVHFVVADTAG